MVNSQWWTGFSVPTWRTPMGSGDFGNLLVQVSTKTLEKERKGMDVTEWHPQDSEQRWEVQLGAVSHSACRAFWWSLPAWALPLKRTASVGVFSQAFFLHSLQSRRCSLLSDPFRVGPGYSIAHAWEDPFSVSSQQLEGVAERKTEWKKDLFFGWDRAWQHLENIDTSRNTFSSNGVPVTHSDNHKNYKTASPPGWQSGVAQNSTWWWFSVNNLIGLMWNLLYVERFLCYPLHWNKNGGKTHPIMYLCVSVTKKSCAWR